MKFRTQFNPDYKGTPSKVNDNISQTVPDQSISLADLLKHHSRGQMVRVPYRQGDYFDTEIPIIDDLNTQKEVKEQLIQDIEQADAKAIEETENAKKKRIEEETKKQIAAKKKAAEASKEEDNDND